MACACFCCRVAHRLRPLAQRPVAHRPTKHPRLAQPGVFSFQSCPRLTPVPVVQRLQGQAQDDVEHGPPSLAWGLLLLAGARPAPPCRQSRPPSPYSSRSRSHSTSRIRAEVWPKNSPRVRIGSPLALSQKRPKKNQRRRYPSGRLPPG
jgi:hypothetical protein